MEALPIPTSPAEPATRYLNRELSWLDFNERVLALAEDVERPILARVKFVAICSQSLDEFFQVRVSGLLEQLEAGVIATTPDGMRPEEQLAEIRSRVTATSARIERLFSDELRPALDKEGIRLVDTADLTDEDRAWSTDSFAERIFPVLTPLAVDPAHPFPYISSLSLNLAVLVRDPVTGVRRFARLKMPPLLPRFFPLPDGERFIPIEQVVAAHLDRLFPGMEIVTHHVFRVTRDADLDVEEDEAEDLLAAVESVLSRRRRGATSVRLEIERSMTDEVRSLLMRELDLEEDQIYETDGPLDLGALWGFVALDRPELKEAPWTPVTPSRLSSEDGPPDVFRVLREGGDVLVHHPYDSFSSSVEVFVSEAASDPDVMAIKQTLYRTSADTPIVRALIRAAEAGKQVVALVELQARFDEQANITWARTLEQAGVHVVYGVVGLKTHAKVCLVVRREGTGIRRYAHLGTGNYNSDTARVYEDLGLLTADQQLGNDVADLFNLLTGYSRQRGYGRLLVAPIALRSQVIEMIRQQQAVGEAGRIALKLNSLVDPQTIDALYEASSAGVRIDLAVRGICCLRPKVPGLSETIRVRSIVGRFLEHSRIYRFGEPERGGRYYISSADLMPRNLDRRVEAAVPVDDPALRERLDEIIEVTFADDVLSWELNADGSWSKVPTEQGVDVQETMMTLAIARARERR
jgi:polyphosphate kinase